MDFGGLGLNHVGIFGFGVDCVVKDLIIDSIDLISKAPQSAFLFGYAKNCTFENILIRNTNDGNNSLLFNVPFFKPKYFFIIFIKKIFFCREKDQIHFVD